jgi:hypothetical protein
MTWSRRNGFNSGLKPATAHATEMMSFPLGSLESRAAARSLIEAREAMGDEGILFRVSVMANPGAPGTRCNCKVPPSEQFAICKCFMPSAITKGLS